MSIETNLNVTPFFNDYDKDKQYYKILFRPGVSVQARELTQIQDILQNQVESFGDHVFKSGTIVSGVNFQFYPNYNYAKVLDTQVDGQPTAVASYQNLYARNSANLQAKIINYKSGFQSTDPDMNYLYFKYINSGDSGNVATYSNGDILTIFSKSNPIFDFTVIDGGTGFSNTDTVHIVSQLLVSNSTLDVGATISQGSGATSANLFVISSNTNFEIVIDDITYKSDDGYEILYVRPITNDLANVDVTDTKWNITPGSSVVQGANSAYVHAKIGLAATAVLTTDTSGVITDISLTNGGQGYVVPPYITVRGGSIGSYSSLQITSQMFKAQVTIADSTFTGGGSNPVGNAYAFGVTDGVIYQKGFFLKVDPQTIIVNAYSTNVDSVSVGFTTTESIVNNSVDSTLLDNATGSYNFAAPGASRLKLVPTLKVIPQSNVASNNSFFTLVDFRDGLPYKQNKNTSYNVLEKEFEKRTDETSGSFVIDPFEVGTRDRTTWSNTHFNVVVDPGVAYINGIRLQTEKNTFVPTRRSNDKKTLQNQSVSLDYGSYIEVNNYAGYFDNQSAAEISLYNSPRNYYSDNLSSITPAGAKIGTARIRSITFASGVIGSPSAVHRIYLFDINMDAGKSFKDVRSIYYDGAGSLDGVADVITQLDPSTNKQIASLYDSNRSSLVYDIGVKGVANVGSASYKYRTTTQQANISSNGMISFSITDSFGFGNNATLTRAQKGSLILTTTANAQSTNVASSATATKGKNYLIGTNFASYFRAGDVVKVFNPSSVLESIIGKVESVANGTYMTIDSQWPYGTQTAASIARFIPANQPFSIEDDRVIANTNSSGNTLNIYLGGSSNTFALSSLVPINMTYDVSLNNVAAISKLPKRNILVKIALANNAGGTTGPWCLGLPDVFRLNAVYVSNGSTVNTSSQNITTSFFVDNGQTSDFYGHSSLVKQPGTQTLNTNDWLLASVDFFDLPTTTTTGYITIDSYPLNNNNATRSVMGNTSVNILEIPSLKTTNGNILALENVIDFRPRVQITANVTSNPIHAQVNPAPTKNFGSHAKKFPTPDTSFSFNYDYYLSRKDRVVLNLEGNIDVIEGSPATAPLAPPETGDQISLGIINIPPYPSLPEVLDGNLVDLLTTRLSAETSAAAKRQDYQVTDTVGGRRYSDLPRRYTMLDISRLEKRIDNLEYYNSLSLLEKKTVDLTIPSSISPALNRFKHGVFVDKFSDYLQIDLTNIDSTATVDQSRGYLQPLTKTLNISGMFNYANTTTYESLHSESDIVELGFGSWGETVLTLPTDGTYDLVNQGRFTSAISGVGGDVQFVGDMVIKPSSLKVLFKGELKITDVYDVSTSRVYDVATEASVFSNNDPVYVLSADKMKVTEGSTVTFEFQTINVANNTSFAYTITGVSANDVNTSLTGTLTVIGNTSLATASLVVQANADLTSESTETLVLTVNTSPNTSVSVDIIDDGIVPVFRLQTSNTSAPDVVAEGESITLVLSTENVNNGITIPYTITGAGITEGDLTYPNNVPLPLTGSMTVNSTGGSSLTIKAALDFVEENTGSYQGSEFVVFRLGDPANISRTIQIIDTPAPRFTLTANATNIFEGNAVTFSLTSVPSVNNGVTIPYTISGVAANDINQPLSGNLTVQDGFANISIDTIAEMYTSGSPTLTLTADLRAWQLANAATSVIVTDTTPYPPVLTVDKDRLSLGQTAIFTLYANNHANGTQFEYSLDVDNSIVVNVPLTGNLTITSNTATLPITSNAGPGQAQMATLTIIANTGNVSRQVYLFNTDKRTASVSANAISIQEGDTVLFTVTAEGSNGNTWNYTLTGIQPGDVNVSNGTLTISNNVATLAVTANIDGISESSETLTLSVNCVSTNTGFANQVLTQSVLINNYSPPMTLTANTYAINESETVLVTLQANGWNGNTFAYTISGVSAGDIDVTNGNVTIASNVATLSITANVDGVVETTESMTVTFDTASAIGANLATTILISDNTTVTHAASANKSVVNEGDSVVITLTSSGVGNTTYNYVITGTGIDANDFVGGANVLANTITMVGNTKSAVGTVTLTAKNDIFDYVASTETPVTPFATRTTAPTGNTDYNKTHTAWSQFLNDYGVWNSDINSKNFDHSYLATFPYTGEYTIEYSCDNYCDIYIDGTLVVSQPTDSRVTNFTTSTTKKVTVSSGSRTIRLVGINTGRPGAVAVRITGVQTAGGFLPDSASEVFNFAVASANSANVNVTIAPAPVRYTLTSDKSVVFEGDTVNLTLSSIGEGNATFKYTVSGANVTSDDFAPVTYIYDVPGANSFTAPLDGKISVKLVGPGGGGGSYHSSDPFFQSLGGSLKITGVVNTYWNYLHNGTQDWTFETWFITNNVTAKAGGTARLATTILDTTTGDGINIMFNNSTGNPLGSVNGSIQFYQYGTGNGFRCFTTAANAIVKGKLHHMAIVYDSTTDLPTLYVDGVSVPLTQGTASWTSISTGNAVTQLQVGQIDNGWLHSLRIVKSKVFTSNFTPFFDLAGIPAITNTDLLVFQQATFKDQSPNAFATATVGTISCPSVGCGGRTGHPGGNGGRGGVIIIPEFSVSAGQTYNFEVGSGGLGGYPSLQTYILYAEKGNAPYLLGANGVSGVDTTWDSAYINSTWRKVVAPAGKFGTRGGSDSESAWRGKRGADGGDGQGAIGGLGGVDKYSSPTGGNGSNGYVIITATTNLAGSISPVGNVVSASNTIPLKIERNRDGNNFLDEVVTFTVGAPVNLSTNFTIKGDPFPVSYTLTSNKKTVEEGNTVTFTLTTTGVEPKTYGWGVTGPNIYAADFENGITRGIVTTTGDYFHATGDITLRLADELSDVAAEELTLSIADGANVSNTVSIISKVTPKPALIVNQPLVTTGTPITVTFIAPATYIDNNIEWFLIGVGGTAEGAKSNWTELQKSISDSGSHYWVSSKSVPTTLLATGITKNDADGTNATVKPNQGILPLVVDGDYCSASITLTTQNDDYSNFEAWKIRAVLGGNEYIDSPIFYTTDGPAFGTWSASFNASQIQSGNTASLTITTLSEFPENRFNYLIEGVTSQEICGAALSGTLSAFKTSSGTTGIAKLDITANSAISTQKNIKVSIGSAVPKDMTPEKATFGLIVTPTTVTTVPTYGVELEFLTTKQLQYRVTTSNVVDNTKLWHRLIWERKTANGWEVKQRYNRTQFTVIGNYWETLTSTLLGTSTSGWIPGDKFTLVICSADNDTSIVGQAQILAPSISGLTATDVNVKIGY